MIVFDLRCAPAGHVFEGWFGSSADYHSQKERGLVSCPLCGSAEVSKAPVAPAVPAKGNAAAQAVPSPQELFSGAPAEVKAMLAAAAAVQKRLLANSEGV